MTIIGNDPIELWCAAFRFEVDFVGRSGDFITELAVREVIYSNRGLQLTSAHFPDRPILLKRIYRRYKFADVSIKNRNWEVERTMRFRLGRFVFPILELDVLDSGPAVDGVIFPEATLVTTTNRRENGGKNEQ